MNHIQCYDLPYVGKKIATRRKELGLTQEMLAEKLDCSITHLCRIESGAKPSLDALVTICRVLGFSMDELLGLYPSDDPLLQELYSLLLTRSRRELRMLVKALPALFFWLDRYTDPMDDLKD